jgi:hypothetical protein
MKFAFLAAVAAILIALPFSSAVAKPINDGRTPNSKCTLTVSNLTPAVGEDVTITASCLREGTYFLGVEGIANPTPEGFPFGQTIELTVHWDTASQDAVIVESMNGRINVQCLEIVMVN